ncbi:phosphoribosylanthranilate isomerase [Chitinophaga agrisoli]|uniref:N-(5'-phosphoribosyl)anthranilate isomerase n=1 Tax=Chitinophaga agrisoli TaxID=2607653 RepID=A0A5B2VU52_9BACT|nr:phosphoribosylanthranilate isomerase [Chitinophaga agrisoli]KAA2241766.1 phosphoribosylanthranilate isomerase [Chitinophaga agrisoli]
MESFIKVCGITQLADLQALVQYGVDYAGFIFYEKSPRFVTGKLDAAAAKEITGIKKVGVFVDADLQVVKDAIHNYGLSLVQLHGNETPAYCAAIREVAPVIKAFRIGAQVNWQQLEPWIPVTDYFLFDTAAGKAYGGTGQQFNWDLLGSYPFAHPFFLSGGIGPEHAASLQQLQLPALVAVDVNSCFETAPGIKDMQQVQAFVQQLRSQTK